MSPQQLRKLERLAKVLDNGDVELLTQLDQLETKVDKDMANVMAVVTEALAVAEQTKKLEGKQGVKGERGKQGERGRDGKDGRNGVDGRDGLDGKDGVDGKDGLDGKDGKDGEKGDPGADGFIDEATIGYLEEELKRIDKKNGGYGQVVRKLRAGNNISIDETNMEYPTISVTPQITVSDTAPTSPATNDIWIDTNAYTYRAVTSAYTATLEDYMLDCTGLFTLTLPTAVGFTGEYIIKNSGTGTITVDGNGAETIDGGVTADVPNLASIIVRSNQSNWIII